MMSTQTDKKPVALNNTKERKKNRQKRHADELYVLTIETEFSTL